MASECEACGQPAVFSTSGGCGEHRYGGVLLCGECFDRRRAETANRPEVTEAMVEAAWRAYLDADTDGDSRFTLVRDFLRAALQAALSTPSSQHGGAYGVPWIDGVPLSDDSAQGDGK